MNAQFASAGSVASLHHHPAQPGAPLQAVVDAICQGLRARMTHKRQGVLAEVVRSGKIRVGNTIRAAPSPDISHSA